MPSAPAEAEKTVNEDFVLRPKLMNSSVIIGKNIADFKADKIKLLVKCVAINLNENLLTFLKACSLFYQKYGVCKIRFQLSLDPMVIG